MSGRRPAEQSSAQPPAEPWSVPITLAEIPESGRRVDLAPDAATRATIARFAGVVDLPRLEAGFDLSRIDNDSVRVVGRVLATVVQSCVVTLDPVHNEVEEAVNLVFAPTTGPKTAPEKAMQSVDSEDPLEELRHGAVDLGAIATEFLILGIDPYPRKLGVTFDSPAVDDPASHPFAALAALKKGNEGKDP
jgi:uncharacterized metal-binding protein YceD (DUF177 family)